MEYRLIRQSRKTLSLRLDEQDGTVVVTAPRWISRRQIDAFVQKHADWIAKQQVRRQQKTGGGT